MRRRNWRSGPEGGRYKSGAASTLPALVGAPACAGRPAFLFELLLADLKIGHYTPESGGARRLALRRERTALRVGHKAKSGGVKPPLPRQGEKRTQEKPRGRAEGGPLRNHGRSASPRNSGQAEGGPYKPSAALQIGYTVGPGMTEEESNALPTR